MNKICGIDGSMKGSGTVSEQKQEKNNRTGLDVAKNVSEVIKREYPGLSDAHAMRLAVMLAKTELSSK